jgi:hypothetical protein
MRFKYRILITSFTFLLEFAAKR